MAGIEVARSFLPSLRHHPGRIGLTGNASRAELFPLLVVFGLSRSPVVDLWAQLPIFFIDLPTVFRCSAGARILSLCHRWSPVLFEGARCDIGFKVKRRIFQATANSNECVRRAMNEKRQKR
jgi:hypothetical protein